MEIATLHWLNIKITCVLTGSKFIKELKLQGHLRIANLKIQGKIYAYILNSINIVAFRMDYCLDLKFFNSTMKKGIHFKTFAICEYESYIFRRLKSKFFNRKLIMPGSLITLKNITRHFQPYNIMKVENEKKNRFNSILNVLKYI